MIAWPATHGGAGTKAAEAVLHWSRRALIRCGFPALPAERDLFVVPDGKRAAVVDESRRLLRSSLQDHDVTFAGEFFTVPDANVLPKPPVPLDIWLGGASEVGFRRIGALGDGWLGSFLTPTEAGQARLAIGTAAEAAGRVIEPDH